MSNNGLNSLKDAPTLVEIFRGTTEEGSPIIDCVHRGLISVVTGQGEHIYSCGDQKTLIHVRSCAKPFQVLPLLELGFFLESQQGSPHSLCDLAVMMSSHVGAPMHTERVLDILKAYGLSISMLRCGTHPPQDEHTKKDLCKNGLLPTALHNNCSGKHAAMLITCLKRGFDVNNYEDLHHPLQQQIRNVILDIAALSPQELSFGIDGCSLPAWAMPIEQISAHVCPHGLLAGTPSEQQTQVAKGRFQKHLGGCGQFPRIFSGREAL